MLLPASKRTIYVVNSQKVEATNDSPPPFPST